MQPAVQQYLDVIRSQQAASPAEQLLRLEWLQSVVQLPAAQVPGAFVRCSRQLGSAPVLLPAEQLNNLQEQQLPSPRGWTMATAGRVVLLLLLSEQVPEPQHTAAVTRLYRTGDNAERIAILKALAALPHSERFIALGADACRSHVQEVFEAIACNNPFPARKLPDEAFNQLVLKALFTEVSTRTVVGLPERRSSQLATMVRAYASERAAAGRSIPADLDYVLGTF